MKTKLFATLILAAASAHAATSQLSIGSGFVNSMRTNARRIATAPGGRLFTVVPQYPYGGGSYMQVASTIDGAIWTVSTPAAWSMSGADRDPSIVAVTNTISVIYASGASIVYKWCTPVNGVCGNWQPAVTIGTGQTPSATAVNGRIYVAWDNAGSIQATNFAPGGAILPVQSVIQGSGGVFHRLPAIVGRWNSTTNWADVSVFHYSQIPGSWHFLRTDWTQSSGWMTTANLMNRTFNPSTQPVLTTVAASINQATGARTAALSVSDSSGAGAWLFNGTTSLQILGGLAYITLDSLQGCANTGVRMAMKQHAGNTAWYETRNHSTLAQVGAPKAITVSGLPIASAWSRYYTSGLTTAYTDRVEVIYPQVHPWDVSDVVKAEYFRVNGFQGIPACELGGAGYSSL